LKAFNEGDGTIKTIAIALAAVATFGMIVAVGLTPAIVYLKWLFG